MSTDTKMLDISGMTCSHCIAAVRTALTAVPGVAVEDVQIGSAVVRLASPSSPAAIDAVISAVQDAGYEATVAEDR